MYVTQKLVKTEAFVGHMEENHIGDGYRPLKT